MKKLQVIFALLFLTAHIFPQTVTINVPTAGTLSSVAGTKIETAQKIIITGTLDGYDFDFIRAEVLKSDILKTFDLANVKIVAGGDALSGGRRIVTRVDIIPEHMFSELNTIEEVIIPTGVWMIDFEAFKNCRGLKRITIPSSVKNLYTWSFVGTTSLKSVVFEKPTKPTEGLESIEMGAFAGSGLETFTFPETVKRLDDGIFAGSNLREIVLPINLASIPARTFADCANLEKVTLSENMNYIGSEAFADCKLLMSMHFRGEFPPRCDVEAFSELEARQKDLKIYVPKGAKNTYKTDNWWKNFALITEYGVQAEKKSVHLQTAGTLSTVLGAEATTINELTVSGPLNGTDIKLIRRMVTDYQLIHLNMKSASIVEGGLDYYATTSGGYGTKNNEITDYMFYNLFGLEFIILPDNVTKLYHDVFTNCRNLTSVSLPKGLTFIGSNTFKNVCALTDIDIPVTVDYLGSSSFAYCLKLTDIRLPRDLEAINLGTFEGCVRLQSVTIQNKVTEITYWPFKDCIALKEIDIPSSVKSLGYRAFAGCSQLEKVSMTDGLTTIDAEAFSDCKMLTSIVLPNTLTTMGDNAFRNCSELTSVKISENLTSIGKSVFSNTALKSVTIPAGVKKIDNFAFNTTPLLEIKIVSPTPSECSLYAFDSEVTRSATLYVPKGSLEVYKSASGWSKFWTIKEMDFSSINSQSPDAQTTVIGRVGDIQIETSLPAQVSIYTLIGVEVSTTTVEAGETAIDLASGMYIVKVGTEARKVVVR